jgi:glycosyltransferase involved in cell wall biosynthesis
MRILLDCRPLIADNRSDGEINHIIISSVHTLADRQGVEWLMLVDGAYREDRLPGISRYDLKTATALPGSAGWRAWYGWQLPRAVKRFKADLLMTTGGIICPGLDRPQCMWMPGRADPAEWTEKKNYARIYRKRMTRSLLEAGGIFTFSEKDRNFLAGKLGNPLPGKISGKIIVVPGAADTRYEPLSAGKREEVKKAWAQGKEYFLTIVPEAQPAELVDLLKAFSGFKKRQRSNIQLVLARTGAGRDIVFPEGKLDTYRYRQDVHVYDNFPDQEMPGLMAASYAFVAPFRGESPGLSLLNAWQAGVPVITTVAGCPPERTEDRVLYALPGDQASLAAQLMLLYKDESLRSSLIGKALLYIRQSEDWDGSPPGSGMEYRRP